jgi:hypothetical protein
MKRTLDPRYDANGMRRPDPLLGMQPRTRLNGEKYLVHVAPIDLVLRPGDELHLVRIAADGDDAINGCTHALKVVRHVGPWEPSREERDHAVRLDGLGSLKPGNAEAAPW